MSGRTDKRRTKIGGQFAPRLIEMLESPAMAVLSLSGHRLLNRIEIEMGHHGGTENGKLPVTYADFVHYGIDRHAIAPAIREAVALGLVEVTEQGRAGNAEFRSPSLYRLTFRHTERSEPPTNGDASRPLRKPSSSPKRPDCRQSENRKPVGGNANFRC